MTDPERERQVDELAEMLHKNYCPFMAFEEVRKRAARIIEKWDAELEKNPV